MSKGSGQIPDGPKEVTGWDVVFAIATRIVSVLLSILLTAGTLHFSFELLDYIQLAAQSGKDTPGLEKYSDGFDKLGMLVISALVFIPITYVYFKILRHYIEKLIKHMGRAK